MADQINGRLAMSNPFELRSKFMAFRLQDGTTDGTIYDSIPDAKKHTDEFQCCYFAFLNMLGGTNEYECAVYLDFHRKARDAGLGQKDPAAVPFMSTYGHDVMGGRLN